MCVDIMRVVLCAVIVVLQQGPSVFTTAQSPIGDVQHRSLVATAGNNISLSCSSPYRAKFRWFYWPHGSRVFRVVYDYGEINRHFEKAARVRVSNCGDRECTFNVVDLQLDD